MIQNDITQSNLDLDQEGYALDVNEVAVLLGVTRTRVSQLTRAGQLSFERRRVGTRNRLFYKRSEVLAHQRGFYGRHVAGDVGNAESPDASSVLKTEETKKRFALETHRTGASFRTAFFDPSEDGLEPGHPALARIQELSESNQRLLARVLELSEKTQQGQSKQAQRTTVSAAAQLDQEAKNKLLETVLTRIDHLEDYFKKQQAILNALMNESNALKDQMSEDYRGIKKELYQLSQLVLKNSLELKLKSHFTTESRLSTGLVENRTQTIHPDTDTGNRGAQTIRRSTKKARSVAKRALFKRR